MGDFEIGVVYEKNKKYFVAVTQATVVTCKGGKDSKIKPSSTYTAIRSLTVQELCKHWGITLAQLDTMMSKYLSPPQSSLKTRPRGQRKRGKEEEEFWHNHRTGRVVRMRSSTTLT